MKMACTFCPQGRAVPAFYEQEISQQAPATQSENKAELGIPGFSFSVTNYCARLPLGPERAMIWHRVDRFQRNLLRVAVPGVFRQQIFLTPLNK
jgi:hypothetical protein